MSKTRVRMDFRVTVLVDVDERRPSHLADRQGPAEYAKQFVTISPEVYGSHMIDVLPNGQSVNALEVVNTEVEWSETYVI